MTAGELRGALDVFALESARLWRLGLAALLFNSGLLTYFGRATDLLQQQHFVVESVGAAYALSGWALGVFQFGSLRRQSHWVYLIHRPLSARCCAAAIVAVGALLILAAVALPGIALVGAQDLLSERIVDGRHWLFPPAGFLITFSAYLAGAFAALVRRLFAPLMIALPAAFAISNMTGIWALGLQLVVACWLLGLVISAFKADPEEAAMRPVAVAATAPLAALAVYLLLLFGAGALYQAAWIAIGTHPLNGGAPRGGFVEAARAPGQELIAAGLADAAIPARSFRPETRAVTIVPDLDRIPVWGEIVNSAQISFDDDIRGVTWTFSHDGGVFRGFRYTDGSAFGTLAPSLGGGGLDRPPLQIGEGLMTDGGRLLRYEPAVPRILSHLVLRRDETLVARPRRFGTGAAMLTAQALYVQISGRLSRLPLPAPAGGLERIDLVPFEGGYLASFTYGRGWAEGRGSAFQQIVRVGDAGAADLVGSRSLERDYPALFRLRGWWLSPALHSLMSGFPDLLAPPAPLPAPALSRVSGAPVSLALLLTFLSAVGTFWWTGKAARPATERGLWTALAVIVGIPGFLAALLYYTPGQYR